MNYYHYRVGRKRITTVWLALVHDYRGLACAPPCENECFLKWMRCSSFGKNTLTQPNHPIPPSQVDALSIQLVRESASGATRRFMSIRCGLILVTSLRPRVMTVITPLRGVIISDPGRSSSSKVVSKNRA
ncbi:hypothetical protein CEXT_545491 [Caerostris extrusa]|uniref:Uncharacterized protein n=1 Tax=Caerostris extrusa TaxID=172846 RepID=A0AAV4NG28_CAEEX|nr:hypothetical protein CEXT_545491 [Caerostris extrusa]